MRILLSNDDGVHAPGIQTLAKALREFADVQVVAPDRNRSGASNSLTLESSLRTFTFENGDIAVQMGTPTDCVYLGVNALMRPRPDIVVSGINAGPNLGDDVIYSGTVAAAMEGRHLGFPALAVSLDGHKHYDTAAANQIKTKGKRAGFDTRKCANFEPDPSYAFCAVFCGLLFDQFQCPLAEGYFVHIASH